jgi:putative ABC transport system substrate-binding protein
VFDVRRRKFITLLGGAAAASAISRPPPTTAQQGALPVVGFLSGASAAGFGEPAAAFRKGLSQGGAVDGRNVTIEYRWAENHYDRLPGLAADLVRRQVAVLFGSGGDASAQAAKAATATIPVVIIFAGDPVAAGMVASLNHPGGNFTGVTLALALLEQKRLELLHQMVPTTRTIAVMMNPTNPRVQSDQASIEAAAEKLGVQVAIVHAGGLNEFEVAVASAIRLGAAHSMSRPIRFSSGRWSGCFHWSPGTPFRQCIRRASRSVGRSDELRYSLNRGVPSSGHLCRSNPFGCESSGPADIAAYEI